MTKSHTLTLPRPPALRKKKRNELKSFSCRKKNKEPIERKEEKSLATRKNRKKSRKSREKAAERELGVREPSLRVLIMV